MRPYINILFITSVWLLLGLSKTKAQDAILSQYYANSGYLNPAMIAQNSQMKLALNYRDRKLNSEATFKTFVSSFEYRFPNSKSALALQFFTENQGNGQLKDQRVSLLYSYRIQINRKWSLSSGVQFYSGEKSIDQSKLIFEDQITDGQITSSSREILNDPEQNYYNLASGLLLEGEKFFFGLAVHHLNQNSNQTFDQFNLGQDRKYTIHSGINLKSKHSRYSFISPNFIIQKQAGSELISLGNYFQLGQIEGGIWYRMDQAIVFSLGIRLEKLNIGYSTDLNMGGLQNANAHEISIAFRFEGNQKKSAYSKTGSICPGF